MKKELFLLATAAAMLTACVNTDSLYDVESLTVDDGSINFLTSTENITKGSNSAENSNATYTWLFLNNHDDFSVWGFKSNAPTNPVFGSALSDDKSTTGVTVDASNNYAYSPKRFWDKAATSYYFYAAAPATLPTGEAWTLNYDDAATDIDEGYFTTTSTLTGVNLKNQAAVADPATDAVGPGTELSNYFKGTGEIDRLIADKCPVDQGRYASTTPAKVHLNFIHILSKLNITIKKDASTLPDGTYSVILKEFAVYNMPATGDFNESTAAQKTGSNDRWDASDDYDKKKTYYALTNVEANATDGTSAGEFKVKTTANYILESLVIPQDIIYERVALDGAQHDVVDAKEAKFFDDYEEYAKANPIETLTEAEFTTILGKKAAGTASETELESITKEPAKPKVEAYSAVANTSTTSSQPYFKIRYTINGDEFTAFYNLAAAFKSLTNNEILTGDGALTDTQKTFAFNEGWQNTLNITINPTAIEFTADVAKWDKAGTDPEIEVIN